MEIEDKCCIKFRIVLSRNNISFTFPDNSKIIEFFFNTFPSFTYETKVNIGNLVSKNFFKNNCPHKTISSLLEIIALPFFK